MARSKHSSPNATAASSHPVRYRAKRSCCLVRQAEEMAKQARCSLHPKAPRRALQWPVHGIPSEPSWSERAGLSQVTYLQDTRAVGLFRAHSVILQLGKLEHRGISLLRVTHLVGGRARSFPGLWLPIPAPSNSSVRWETLLLQLTHNLWVWKITGASEPALPLFLNLYDLRTLSCSLWTKSKERKKWR